MSATQVERASVRVPQQRAQVVAPSTVAPQALVRRTSGITRLPMMALLVDVVGLALTVTVATLGRNYLGLFDSNAGEIAAHVLPAAPAIALSGLAVIAILGGYQNAVVGAGTDEYRRVVNAWFLTGAVVGIGSYLTRFPLPRGFFVLLLVLGIPLLVGGRYALRQGIRRQRRRGGLQRRVLIVGSEVHVNEVAVVLSREPSLGYDVIGALTPRAHAASTFAGIPVLGDASDVAARALETEADVVVMAGGAVDSAAHLREIAWQLEHSSTQLVVAPSVTDISAQRVSVRPVSGLPLLHLDKPRSMNAVRRAKRTFDAIGSFALLIAFAPVFTFAAYKIKRFDGGPVLFRQTRIGRDGKAFLVWKFRTMVTDAEGLLATLHDAQGYEGGLFKMQDDPRVTRPGRWLRRYSLDELPQLVNVLRGDMSLVGPRPPLRREVEKYDRAIARRLQVRPGMTGLWQVSGRSDLSWSEAVRLDLYYVDNWSMVQDLSILARTLRAVVGSRGAY